jgi:hypothetical protein
MKKKKPSFIYNQTAMEGLHIQILFKYFSKQEKKKEKFFSLKLI